MKASTLKVMLVAGARPNFMKIAPIIKAIDARNSCDGDGATRIEARLVHTGQHYDEAMSEVFFRELGMRKPDINLGVGSGSHATQTAKVMTEFERVCEPARPDWLVVVGDVNSTMACTLVCSKIGVRVAHVEAGLRSYDRTMPEEVNRVVTDALADLLFTVSQDGNDNLKNEGIAASRVRLVGNVMIDALVANLEQARGSQLLNRLGLRKKTFIYVTLHRPSNVDCEQALGTIMSELKRIAKDWPVVFPIHPRTRKMCSRFGIALDDTPGFRILEPIGYHDSLSLTESARFVLTDSGGLQEESTYFRTPCLTLRANTERPITITVGSNKLTTIAGLSADISEVLARNETAGRIPPMWDGKTSQRIVESLLQADLDGRSQASPSSANDFMSEPNMTTGGHDAGTDPVVIGADGY